MKRTKYMTGLLMCLFSIGMMAVVSPSLAADTPSVVVGRVYYIEGELLRYVPETNDWVAVVRDTPFGTEDTLFTGSRGLGELIAPNGTWIRIGNSTQIQFIALDMDFSEMDVATGVARIYNKSTNTIIKVTCPFGYVLADPGTVFDFYVGENSVEVLALIGKVSFIHSATNARYDALAGSPSILVDQQQVTSGNGMPDPDWDRWNVRREGFWAMKTRETGRSAEYLPPNLRNDAYILEENGRWENVYYEGESRWLWQPTTVAVGWRPFSVGRWTDYYGDQCWVPAEPFGYTTHHYGNWVHVSNSWYWAPPVVGVRVGLPLLDVGFYWYPGRVSWIHRGAYVGWVPLAPREMYYSHRYWGGPYAGVVTNANIAQININIGNYAYANQAVVVNQDSFYSVNNYSNVQVTNINNTTIVNDYSAAPVVNETVVNNYTTNTQRYNYTNATVAEKPHNAVVDRIQYNKTIIQEGRVENAVVAQERVKRTEAGRINQGARVEPPKSTNYIVPASKVNQPKSELKLQQRAIKSSGNGARQGRQPQQQMPDQTGRTERVSPARPDQTEKTSPDRTQQGRQPQQEVPGQTGRTERVSPPKPDQTQKASPERKQPGSQPQQQMPAQTGRTERVSPPRPEQTEQVSPDRTQQGRQPQQQMPAQTGSTERVSPPKPDQTQKASPEHKQPGSQPQQQMPAQTGRTERVSPAKPAQTEKASPDGTVPEKPDARKKNNQPEK